MEVMFKWSLNLLLPGGFCCQWTVLLSCFSFQLWIATDADDAKREFPKTFELVVAELMVILKSFIGGIRYCVCFQNLVLTFINNHNHSHFFIFICCFAVYHVNERSFVTFNCGAGIGPQSHRNRPQWRPCEMTSLQAWPILWHVCFTSWNLDWNWDTRGNQT